jgi:hypothetical protein
LEKSQVGAYRKQWGEEREGKSKCSKKDILNGTALPKMIKLIAIDTAGSA